jgi:hypothetical protein
MPHNLVWQFFRISPAKWKILRAPGRSGIDCLPGQPYHFGQKGNKAQDACPINQVDNVGREGQWTTQVSVFP